MLLKLILLLASIPLAYLVTPILLGKLGNVLRFAVIIFHGIFLTFVLFFFSNDPQLILHDEVSLMQNIEHLRRVTPTTTTKFINDNIVCIDVSGDKVEHSKVDDKTKVALSQQITSRKDLADFLDTLGKHPSLIDLVVVDVGFEDDTKFDCALGTAIKDLDSSNKIICAKPEKIREDSCLKLPAWLYGNVSEQTHDGLFISHEIFSRNSYSLAYDVYSKIKKLKTPNVYFDKLLIESDSTGRMHIGLNTFLPKYYVSDKDFLVPATPVQANSKPEDKEGITTKTINFRQLGDVFNEQGFFYFIRDLEQRKNLGLKNIIVIGSFVGSEDEYLTAYGKQHGITILLNLIFSLMHHDHLITILTFVKVALGFVIISWLMVYIKLKQCATTKGMGPFKLDQYIEGGLKRLKAFCLRHESFGRLTDFFVAIITFFFEELYLILLIVLVFVLYRDNLFNGMSFFIYFSVISRLLEHFFKYSK